MERSLGEISSRRISTSLEISSVMAAILLCSIDQCIRKRLRKKSRNPRIADRENKERV